LLVFGAITLLVGAIITANASILVAQRRRQIGLLRAVGASTAQVRHSFLAEALIIGVLASMAGLAVGGGIAALAASGPNRSPGSVDPMGSAGRRRPGRDRRHPAVSPDTVRPGEAVEAA